MAKKDDKKPGPGRGGKRAGAGRPPQASSLSAGLFIRTSEDQKAALLLFISGFNEKRAAKGLPRVELSTWVRELALKHSGNENLGAAAKAVKDAEAAAGIV